MAMHNPPHPGGIIRRECLEPLGLSVKEAAKALGVTAGAVGPGERKGRSVGRDGDSVV
jgi:plasmid maintenance system antidote protein VapI